MVILQTEHSAAVETKGECTSGILEGRGGEGRCFEVVVEFCSEVAVRCVFHGESSCSSRFQEQGQQQQGVDLEEEGLSVDEMPSESEYL